MDYPVRPAALVDVPPDMVAQYDLEVPPAANVEIRAFQVVGLTSNTADPAAVNTASTRYVALNDSLVHLPGGGYSTLPGAAKGMSQFVGGAKADKIRLLKVSGRRLILTAKGALASAHIGAQKPLVQEDGVTKVDLAGTGTTVTILDVVEGTFGDTNTKVLVQVA